MQTKTLYKHIVLGDDGVPTIEGANMKVVELVLAHKYYDWGPEELHENFPYLEYGQIYSALAYYSDHRDEVEQDIQRRQDRVTYLQGTAPPSLIRERLRADGLVE